MAASSHIRGTAGVNFSAAKLTVLIAEKINIPETKEFLGACFIGDDSVNRFLQI